MTGKYESIQIGRAFAAFIVILLHSISVSQDIASSGLGLPRWLSTGYAGVDVFFVISGFIIALVTDREGCTAGPFLERRLLRIVPFYWLFTCIWFCFAVMDGDNNAQRSLVASLLVLPVRETPVLAVGWTLQQEFVFYAIVALLLALRRIGWLPWTLALLFAVGIVWHAAIPEYWDFRIFSLYQFQFLLGILVYRARGTIAQLSPGLLLGAGAAGFVAAGWLVDRAYGGAYVSTHPNGLPGLVRVVTFGLCGALLIGGLIALERRSGRLLENGASHFAVRLGDASFVLYLSHPLIFLLVGKAARAIGLSASWTAPVLAFAIAAAMGFALAFHRSVEKPFLAWIQGWRTRFARAVQA